MEELETKLTQGPCGERLITKIVLEMKEYYKFHEDSEGVDGLRKAIEVGEKLLSNDYFKSSEAMGDKVFSTGSDVFSNLNKWTKEYNKDLQIKREDYREFFKLIIDNIEDWC